MLNNIIDNKYYNNKNILITGGSGTLGNKIIRILLKIYDTKKICIYSRDEFKQHNMKQQLKIEFPEKFNNLRFFIGDIRDFERTKYAFKEIDIVFHAAALKQVDSIEYNPMEAIKTNILGTQNVVMACIENNVDQLIGISTDKCVAPVNLYGATKLCLEKLIISGKILSGDKLNTCVLRYGNVINSRGSVVPIFLEQKSKGKFTVTDPNMTRFTMTIEQATNFVINCGSISKGGEIFVPKLPKYDLNQLCRVINEENKIEIIGIRPGEKLHEEMIAAPESLRVYESNNFFIISDNLDENTIKKFNFKKSEKIFNYSSFNSEYISDKDLKDQIYIKK